MGCGASSHCSAPVGRKGPDAALRDMKVTPLPNGEHLMLGITIDGINEFLHRIGFPRIEYNFHYEKVSYHAGTYVRNSDKLDWVTQEYGDGFDTFQCERVFVGTGYDLAECVRSWLQQIGKTNLSVCEVLLAEGSPHVKKATIFQSHQQRFPIGGTLLNMWSGMFWHRMALPVTSRKRDYGKDIEAAGGDPSVFVHAGSLDVNDQFNWLDYFVLRQCVSDFKVDQIRGVIKEIGCTQVEVDAGFTYLKRSFCTLEIYASIESGAKILCQTLLSPEEMSSELRLAEVKVENATTRRHEDKQLIDDFIRETGFERVNSCITEALIRGAGAGTVVEYIESISDFNPRPRRAFLEDMQERIITTKNIKQGHPRGVARGNSG